MLLKLKVQYIYGVFIRKIFIQKGDQFYVTGLYDFCVFNCEEELLDRREFSHAVLFLTNASFI